MYYHCRPMKYVKYGKVNPPPEEEVTWLLPAYKWLSNYCGGYCPQIWLARSRSSITGHRRERRLKRSRYWSKSPGLRNSIKTNKDSVLFGFNIIKGFPVSYDHWEVIMNSLINEKVFDKQNKNIVKDLNETIEYYKEENEPLDGEIKDWDDSGRDLDTFLKKYVFVEKDQVVVPSLNLKSAKEIICWNEKQKKKLRKMGFIEDRIRIKNFKSQEY